MGDVRSIWSIDFAICDSKATSTGTGTSTGTDTDTSGTDGDSILLHETDCRAGTHAVVQIVVGAATTTKIGLARARQQSSVVGISLGGVVAAAEIDKRKCSNDGNSRNGTNDNAGDSTLAQSRAAILAAVAAAAAAAAAR